MLVCPTCVTHLHTYLHKVSFLLLFDIVSMEYPIYSKNVGDSFLFVVYMFFS